MIKNNNQKATYALSIFFLLLCSASFSAYGMEFLRSLLGKRKEPETRDEPQLRPKSVEELEYDMSWGRRPDALFKELLKSSKRDPQVMRWLVERGASPCGMMIYFGGDMREGLISTGKKDQVADYLLSEKLDSGTLEDLLILAAAQGDSEIVNFILTHRKEYLSPSALSSAFFRAALAGHDLLVQSLYPLINTTFAHDPNAFAQLLLKVVRWAAVQGRVDVVRFLLGKALEHNIEMDTDALDRVRRRILEIISARETSEYGMNENESAALGSTSHLLDLYLGQVESANYFRRASILPEEMIQDIMQRARTLTFF